MTTPTLSKRIADLVRLYGTLGTLHEQLLGIIEEKIAAMKRADVPAMQGCGEREQVLVKHLEEREGFRCQLMDAIGKDLGLPGRLGRGLTVSQITSRVPGMDAARLVEAADSLRKMVARVAQANRIAAAVGRTVLTHMRWVFAAVRPAGEKPACYTGRGGVVGGANAGLLEVVG